MVDKSPGMTDEALLAQAQALFSQIARFGTIADLPNPKDTMHDTASLKRSVNRPLKIS